MIPVPGRVLPPDAGFRAPARPRSRQELPPHEVDPDASVVVTAGGPTIEAARSVAWYSVGGALRRVTSGAVLAVEPGDVAHGLQQVDLVLRR